MFVFPSFRDGLSVSVMEAMGSGLPIVCSNIHGNTDLVDKNGGVYLNQQQTGAYNLEKVNSFLIKSVNQQMTDIVKR